MKRILKGWKVKIHYRHAFNPVNTGDQIVETFVTELSEIDGILDDDQSWVCIKVDIKWNCTSGVAEALASGLPLEL